MSDINIKISVQGQQAQRAVEQLGRSAQATERQFDRLSLSVRNTTSAFKVFAGNLAANAVGAAANAIGSLVSSSIDSTRALEDLGVQFEVLTGSAGAANDLLQDLTDFTSRTPFRLEGVGDAARQLLAFGFEADTITDRLQDLGDVAAASGADIGEISLIFGQVAAAGQLTGERLLQLQERAIPIGPALAETLGVAESSIRDLVSAGQVSFDQFEQAFNSLNEQGQFAFGGIEKASQTLSGRISTLEDNFSLLAANIGQQVAPTFKVIVTAVTELIQTFTQSGAIEDFATIVNDFLVGSLQRSAAAFLFVSDAVSGFNQFLNSAREFVANTAATIVEFADTVLASEQAIRDFVGVDSSGIQQLRAELQQTSAILRENAQEFETANEQITQSQDDLEVSVVQSVDRIVGKIQEETQAQRAKAAATEESNQAQVESERAKQQQLDQLESDRALQEQERLIAQQQFLQEFSEENIQRLADNLGQEEAIRVASQAKQLADQGQFLVAFSKLKEAEVAAEEKAEQNKLRTQQVFSRQRINIIDSTAQLVSAIAGRESRVTFFVTKAAALARSLINTELAVTNALASVPYPANLAAAAQARLAGRISTAAIAASTVQGFQDGGIVPGSSFSGDRVLARVNSGEMILNREQQAQLFAQANGGDQGQRDMVINTSVQLDGEEIGKAVSRQVANGLELGEVV